MVITPPPLLFFSVAVTVPIKGSGHADDEKAAKLFNVKAVRSTPRGSHPLEHKALSL